MRMRAPPAVDCTYFRGMYPTMSLDNIYYIILYNSYPYLLKKAAPLGSRTPFHYVLRVRVRVVKIARNDRASPHSFCAHNKKKKKKYPHTLVRATDRAFTWPEAQGPVSTVVCKGRGAAGTHASWQMGARAWMGISPAHRITDYRCL